MTCISLVFQPFKQFSTTHKFLKQIRDSLLFYKQCPAVYFINCIVVPDWLLLFSNTAWSLIGLSNYWSLVSPAGGPEGETERFPHHQDGFNQKRFWRPGIVDQIMSFPSTLLFCVQCVPSHERPCDVTPESASLQTLQYVGRAWEQAYQLCIPLKWSMLYWVDWETHSHSQELLLELRAGGHTGVLTS